MEFVEILEELCSEIGDKIYINKEILMMRNKYSPVKMEKFDE